MRYNFQTTTYYGYRWYNGLCYFWEFVDTETDKYYLAASSKPHFAFAISVERIRGQELSQIKELEELVQCPSR